MAADAAAWQAIDCGAPGRRCLLTAGVACWDRHAVVTTTPLTPLQEAQQALQEAARRFGEAPALDVSSRFADLPLRRAAIEFTRELLCALLGFGHSGLEEQIDDLVNIADASLKAPGGIRDPQIAKEVRAYLVKWGP